MDLGSFDNSEFNRGRSLLGEVCWSIIQALFIDSCVPGSSYKLSMLKFFGSKIEEGVCIKPNVRIKFPWRLTVGSNSWIGEDVWIDNLAPVTIGCNCCLSQGVYLCTGSHDWCSHGFDLITKPITLSDCAWLGAFSKVAPGITIGEGAVLTMGSVAVHDLEPWTVYQGNPAIPIRRRIISK